MGKTGLVAIDLGAGGGAKIGVFASPERPLAETILPVGEYGGTAGALADRLVGKAEALLDKSGLAMADVRAIGIATPGLLRSDGSHLLSANIGFLCENNLKQLVEDRASAPVAIDNDANAGGLAEWAVLRVELLYWVLGGGWGGAWISKEGEVRFPSLDWDRDDSSLHYTNEPGYATPLEKTELRRLAQEAGVSYERLEAILAEDLADEDGVVRGPSGNPDHVRAEALLSGPGRWRLFRAVAGEDKSYQRFLSADGIAEIDDPSVAGKHIDTLSKCGVESALAADRLFGEILAYAAAIQFEQACGDGMPDRIPVCLAGKPSLALPFFGPAAQAAMVRRGMLAYLRPSAVDERGSNPNLLGAAVLAAKAGASR